MADELKVIISAEDKASKTVDDVGKKVDNLTKKDATVDLTAEDKASKTIDKVDDATKKLDGKDATVDVKAKDKATSRLDDVLERTRKLDGADATVILKAEASKAERDIRAARKLLAEVDGDDATVVIKAKDEATARLHTINDELARIDATAPTSKLRGFMNTVGEAPGLFGKVKVAGTGALDAIGGAGMGAVAGVAAVGTVLMKSFQKFQETARNARDLAAATGTSVDQASRWIAVADDAGVALEGLSKSLLSVAKSTDAKKWADYGIATHDAEGNVRSVNDIMLDALDTLSKMDEQTRNATGLKLFGKAWADLAPMVGKTREEYEDMLGAISDGQVITDAELKRSEDMREAQDALGDAFGDIEIAIGSVVAALSPLIKGLALVIQTVGNVATAFTDSLGGGNDPLTGIFDKTLAKMTETEGGAEAAARKMLEMGASIDQVNGALERSGASFTIAADGSTKVATKAKDAQDALDEQTSAADNARDASDTMREAMEKEAEAAQISADKHRDAAAALKEQSDAMRAAADSNFALTDAQVTFNDTLAGLPEKLAGAAGDLLKTKQAYDDVAQSAGSVADAQVRVAEETATASGKTLTATEKLDIWNDAMLNAASTMSGPQRNALLDYIASVNDIPPEVVSNISALLDTGSVAAADQSLTTASKARTADVTAEAHTADAESDLNRVANAKYTATITAELVAKIDQSAAAFARQVNKKDSGGIAGSMGAIVAERRPELINVPTWVPPGTRVTSGADTARLLSSSTTINVNLPRGARHGDIAHAIQRHTRRSGRRYGAIHYGVRR